PSSPARPSDVVPGRAMTSPRSPRVQVTTQTARPSAAEAARRPPVDRLSSSGCACTATTPPKPLSAGSSPSSGVRKGDDPALSGTRGVGSGALGAGRRAGALRGVQRDLADADHLGRHLDALVLLRELQRLLERELARRDEVLE